MTKPSRTGAEPLDLDPVTVPAAPNPPEAHPAPGADDTPTDPPSGDDEQ